MTAADALFRLPARSVETVLAELLALRDRLRSGEPLTIPPVTVLLDGGHQLTGEIVACTDVGGADFTVVLKQAANAWDVTYIAGSAIRGVTVHFTPDTVHLLAFGKFRALTDKIPTRLALERSLRSLATQLNPTAPLTYHIAWDELPSTDAALQQLGHLLQDIQSTLLAIQADELGAQAVQEQVQRLELRVNAKMDVTLQAGVLTVSAQVAEHELAALSRSELRQAIERLL